MDDPPVPRQPIAAERLATSRSDTSLVYSASAPAPRPNPLGIADVSAPVITLPSAGRLARFDGTESVVTHRTFDDMFRAHYDRLVRSLTLACGDREQAADAVQEAFVKAHLRWRRISRYDDPIAWVRRVAINHLRDDHRRASRRRRAHDRLAARTPAFEHQVEPDEVERLLVALPRQQRVAIALFYVDGLAVADIAAALGLAEGSVKSHLHDARKRLRTVLDRERGTDGRK